MSPAAMDPEWFLETYGKRPMAHLEDIGVLGDNAIATHVVHVDDEEIEILARTGTSVSHCPTTALKVSYGVTQIGKMPEMVAAGVNVAIGTDGNNASNYHDLMRATYLVAGLFKDARRDANMFPAEDAFAMATRAGARGLCAQDEIGSLEVGKKADLVLHDTHRPEWRPLHNVANQLRVVGRRSRCSLGVRRWSTCRGRLPVHYRGRGRSAAARPDRRRGDPGPFRPSRPRQVADCLA